MSDSQSDRRLSRLGERMRAEWDRRVSHDYRYWMSDGISSDGEMWDVGMRDFDILIRNLPLEALAQQTALELGCGVGRLLRPASRFFKRVIGIDVSEQAVAEAKRLLADCSNVELIAGDGITLAPVPSSSIDFAYTFAALSSMPVTVIGGYLCELARVVKPGGELCLQVYLGVEQDTCEEDTIAVRSFSRERFTAAVAHAGFDLYFSEELSLPFEVSDRDAGLVAEIVRLRRNGNASASPGEISGQLLSRMERSSGEGAWQGSRTEYLMAIARAQQHMDAGAVGEAKKALEFALTHYQEAEAEMRDLLEEIRHLPEGEAPTSGSRGAGDVPQPQAVTFQPDASSSTERNAGMQLVAAPGIAAPLGELFNPQCYKQNIAALRAHFPELAARLESVSISAAVSARLASNGSPVLYVGSTVLSHRDKPQRAAEAWANRALEGYGAREKSKLLVVGFADAYHLKELLRSGKELYVVEPRPEVLKAAMGLIDCRELLSSLVHLGVSGPEVRELLGRISPADAELIIHPQTLTVSAAQTDEIRRLFQAERGWGKLRPNIGVVGPMYGGSLPIAGYVAKGLKGLDQRVTSYDLSGFYGSFKSVSTFLRSPQRTSSIESSYVELMSQLLLEAISERPLDILICLAQAPLSPRVLTECRARGIITVMWFVEDCRRFTTWQQIAPYYDYMFLIQQNEFPRLVEQAGAGRAIYLPVGCDPAIHRPCALSMEERRKFGSEVSFVGAGYNNRRHVFSTFANRDFKIWGTEWPACLPFTRMVQDSGSRVAVEDYVKVFNATKVNVNLHSSGERDGVEPFGDFVNPRTFELAAAGAFQLVDNRLLLPENFVIGKEVATFDDAKELHDKIDYYLARPEERNQIAAAARKRALAEHTYEHRLKSMLDYIYADRYEQISAKVRQGPWPKTLEAAEPHTELCERFQTVFERGDEPTLDALVQDITAGKGSLTETEQRLLFLHHIRSQISHVRKLRQE